MIRAIDRSGSRDIKNESEMNDQELASLRQIEAGSLVDAFAQSQQKNEVAEVLRELFAADKSMMISDLTKDEIKLCTRIKMIADIKGLSRWHEGLDYFHKMMLSKNRLSRKEIVEAIGGYSRPMGIMNRLNPFNRGGMQGGMRY